MASKIIKFSLHSNGRSLHSLCHPGRVLANSKSILPLEQSNRLESGRPFFSWFTTRSNSNSSSVAAPQLPSSPCLMLPPLVNKATREKVFRFLSLADKKVLKIKKNNNSLLPYHARCFWSCQNWLAFIDNHDSSLYLWNPFSSPSQEDVIRLPSILTFPSVGVIHGSDNRSTKSVIVKHTDHENKLNFCHFEPKDLISKLVCSSAPLPSLDNNDCIVMAIKGDDLGLAYCKPGDKKWTVLDAPSLPYRQLFYSKKTQQFYAWSFSDYIETWDLRDLTSIKRTSVFKTDNIGHYPTYIVESLSGDLLLVDWNCSYGIDVYKLDSGKWKNIKCLGEQALFLGHCHQPFSLRPADFPGLKTNSIYFSLNQDNFGLYDMRSNRKERLIPIVRVMRIHSQPVWVVPPQGIDSI